MPFTPFHWGPSSWLGLLFFRFINVGAFLAASVIVDIEPFCVLVFNLEYPLHSFLHSYLGSTIIATLFSLVYYRLRHQINKVLKFFRIAQDSSLPVIFFSCLLGVYFHIFLDSFLYTDIKPFFPLTMNPQYGLISSPLMYLFCSTSFLIGGLFYVTMLSKGKWKNFFKVSSAIAFIGFIIVMGGLSVLQWVPLFDDGPFIGIAYEHEVSGIPDSSLKLNSKFTVETYNRPGEEPILLLRDNAKIVWARVLDVRNKKNYENCRVAELKLMRFQSTLTGYHIQGVVNWTYGREAANFYLNRKGELEKFYLSW